jgi:hypothetical protein
LRFVSLIVIVFNFYSVSSLGGHPIPQSPTEAVASAYRFLTENNVKGALEILESFQEKGVTNLAAQQQIAAVFVPNDNIDVKKAALRALNWTQHLDVATRDILRINYFYEKNENIKRFIMDLLIKNPDALQRDLTRLESEKQSLLLRQQWKRAKTISDFEIKVREAEARYYDLHLERLNGSIRSITHALECRDFFY